MRDVDFRRKIITILKTEGQRKREEIKKSLSFESLIEKEFQQAEPLAQLVEHRPFKPRVAGSTPARLIRSP